MSTCAHRCKPLVSMVLSCRLHGGSVANPLHTLADLVASFHHPNGTIAVDGFYECAHLLPL